MKILEITEGANSNLEKGADQAVPTVAKTDKNSVELITRNRVNLAQIEQLSENPRALPEVIQRLKAVHGDLYDIAHANSQNARIVGEVNRLRDDLAPLIRSMEQNANQPGAVAVLLQSTRQQLVPVLKSKLAQLNTLLQSNS